MGVQKYGKQFPAGTSRLDMELWCLRHDKRADNEGGRLSSFDHFKNATDIIFNNPESTRKHVWHDWSEKNIKAFLGNREPKRFLGVAGASSGGKSNDAALFCIIMYLSGPTETLCVLTSTTLKTAGHRIWKAAREYWSQVEFFFNQQGAPIPGKAVHSQKEIRGLTKTGEFWDGSGLCVIAADKAAGEESGSKLKGMKAPEVPQIGGMFILVADELPDLSYNVVSIAYSNLINNPQFVMIALGNPDLKLDSFGRFCTPKDGWPSVKGKLEWDTLRGRVICYNNEENPRVIEEDDLTPAQKKNHIPKCHWMPGRAEMQAAERDFGRNSRKYCGMYLGSWSDEKDAGCVYSETELMGSEDNVDWDNDSPRHFASGLDSSFTTGGDRSVAVEGICGRVKGQKVLLVTGYKVFDMEDGVQLAPSHQIVQQWRDRSIEKLISPSATGFDNSGAGLAFGHIVDMEWSPTVKKINFGGAPSGRKYSLEGDTKLEFSNRVSELWIQPKQYFRHSQIRGLSPEIVQELVVRRYRDKGDGAKLCVERKTDYKSRTGSSPDLADAFCVLVDVCIQNGWLDSVEEKAIIQRAHSKFTENRKKFGFRTRKTKQLKF